MRFINASVCGAIAVMAILASARTASAQCSAWTCNGSSIISTTTPHVGVGTSNPSDAMEVATGAAGRLRISSDDASHNGNGGVLMVIGGVSQWSVSSYTTGGPDTPQNFFQIYDQPNNRNALLMKHGSNSFAQFGGDVVPNTDTAYNSGGPSNRWNKVFALNGVITGSDARQKKDIADLKYGLQQILKLRPVTYRWKVGPDKDTHVGLLAQEVEKVIPEIVKHGPTPSDPLGMNYSELVPVLIASAQAQQKIINDQQERIARLERRAGVATTVPPFGAVGAGVSVAALPLVGAVVVFRRRRRIVEKSA